MRELNSQLRIGASRAHPRLAAHGAARSGLAAATWLLAGCGSDPSTAPLAVDGGSGDATVEAGSSGRNASSGSATSGVIGSSGSSGAGSGSSSSGTSGFPAGSGAGGDAASNDSSLSPAEGGSGSGNEAAAPAPTGSVLQHHTNPSRDGVYNDPLMTKAFAATLKLDAAFAPTIPGNIYAQPLYATNGPGGKAAFFVATEANHVLAIDASSGGVLWDKQYDPPVTAVGSSWPPGCGNIRPLGITGTPVIDMASRSLFFDSMTMQASPKVLHKIYALSLDDGSIKGGGWPVVVDTAVPGFVSTAQNQRGALQLLNGTVYAAYSGHDGDCGQYFGWVVGVSAADSTSVKAFSVGAAVLPGSPAAKGGIWGTGGPSTDGISLFVTTGNTQNATAWAGGEALLRLSPGPAFTNTSANEFHPANWAMMDSQDIDLGGANPVPFDMSGAPVPRLVVALGKDGYLYLANRDNLGGMGGQLSKNQVASTSAGATGALNGAPAVYSTAKGTYVAYRVNVGAPGGCPSQSIGVAKISLTNPPAATVVWCSPETGFGSPMVTSSGNGDFIVWDANTRLYGYDGDTGTKVFPGGAAGDVMASSMQYFNTPIGAGGRLVVATTNPGHLYVFKP